MHVMSVDGDTQDETFQLLFGYFVGPGFMAVSAGTDAN